MNALHDGFALHVSQYIVFVCGPSAVRRGCERVGSAGGVMIVSEEVI